jgi:hypothetical protein
MPSDALLMRAMNFFVNCPRELSYRQPTMCP